jgi:hypothetical protein
VTQHICCIISPPLTLRDVKFCKHHIDLLHEISHSWFIIYKTESNIDRFMHSYYLTRVLAKTREKKGK